MVNGQIVEGSASEIAEKLTKLVGNRPVRVMLMDVAEANDGNSLTDAEFEKAVEELKAMAVSVPHVDDSREAIYTRMEGE